MSAGRVVRPDSLEEALKISAALDVRFHDLKGDAVVTSKDRAFRELFRILEASGLEYALIGGVAVQLWHSEPRTTLDIDVAVRSHESVPRAAPEAAGFRMLARHPHSENWTGPGETPVQFSDDPALTFLIESASRKSFEGGQVRIASPSALVKEKLRAASDPARRESKRFQDLADAKSLAEEHPEVEEQLTPAERALLKRAL
ncbi:MAG: nucleotidyltransferase [Thermoanaerobaculia bacterium]|nr:nucleotidyltransferase [Thermoanaerobaculia bacterium]